jgi:hypothetical protein
MVRSPLAPIQGKAAHAGSSLLKENTSNLTRCSKGVEEESGVKENIGPVGCNGNKYLAVKTQITATADITSQAHQTSLTPRIALLEQDSSNLLARLQASYKTSRDILQEIYREKADILDLSPLKSVCSEDGEWKDYQDISAYCEGKQFGGTASDGVELDVYQEVSSYCVDKMLLLSNAAELDAITKENEKLLVENNGLREQIEFKTACYIQAEASIASMIKLVKKKEAALEEYDEFLRMNDTSNASIVAAMTKQHAKQIAVLNEQIRNSSEEIKELEHKLGAMERNWSKLKDLCKQKDRQLESAVETAANLERKEKEHANLEAVVKIQSNRIDYLTNLNNEVNQVIHSLTMMLHEKEQAIDDYANFSKMNEEASKKLFEHIGKKHHEEMQDSSDKIKGLLGIIKRQKFGESEYLRVQLREKNQLQLEVDAMKLRLNSYDMDDQILTDAHIIITVVTVSSGLLLLFWSYIAADITNCL